MAQRRMFSKKITETDLFLDMPMSSQCLYFHLNMSADDDGFIGNAKTIRRMIGASEDDLKLLLAKEFLFPFDSGVVVVKDWKIHNYIRSDRYNETVYQEEKKQLKQLDNGRYELGIPNVIPTVHQMDTQVRLGKGYVTGEKINFMSMTDNRGGVWEFMLNDDPATIKIVSVYSSTPRYNVSHVIFDGLAYREHKVTAIFKGDDPNNTPSTGAGTARGWMYTNTAEDAYNTLSGVMKIGSAESKRLLVDGSNKEFAFSAKYNGQQHWLPEHSSVGTVFYSTPLEIYSDGQQIDFLSQNFSHSIFFSELSVVQNCICRISNTDIASLKITHSFNMDGACAWSSELKAIESFEIVDGYPLMLPLANETFDTVVSGIHNSKISKYDDTLSYFNVESDKVHSYAAVDKKSSDYIVACKIETPIKSMRLKETDGHKPINQKMLFSERADFPKLYYHSMFNKSITIGEVYNWSAQIIAAEIKDAYEIFN